MTAENLQSNSFFAALLDHIPHLESNCVEQGWVVCVPQAVSLPESHRMGLHLLKSHVLKPCAERPNEFTSLTGCRVARVGENELNLYQGDTVKRSVAILFKEVIYSGLYGDGSYVALCLACPMEGGSSVPVFDDGTEVFNAERSPLEWEAILFPSSQEQAELTRVEERIIQLGEQMLDPSEKQKDEKRAYTECRSTAERLAKRKVQHDKFTAALHNPKFKTVLVMAYETCIAMQTHGLIFAKISERNAAYENDLQLRLHDLRQLILVHEGICDRVGLTDSFLNKFRDVLATSVWYQRAHEELQNLNDRKTPLEKLWCLKESHRLLGEIKENDNMDDSLPLFLLCVIQAAPALLLSNLQYMTDFAPRSWVKSNGELAFYCTVFNSAVSLIQEHVPSCDEQDSSFFLRNLVVAGGSGIGVNWVGGYAGLPRPDTKNDPASTLVRWFDCVPKSRG